MSNNLRRDYCPLNGCTRNCLDPLDCQLQPGDMRWIKGAREGKGRLFLMTREEIEIIVLLRQTEGRHAPDYEPEAR